MPRGAQAPELRGFEMDLLEVFTRVAEEAHLDDRAHPGIAERRESLASVATLKFGVSDANDERVLATAVQTQAQAVVSENTSDFLVAVLATLNIDARSADEFIAETVALDEVKAVAAIRTLRIRLKRPEMSVENCLRSPEAHGLFITASILTGHAESS